MLLALRAQLREEGWFVANKIPEPNLANYLDLVALGTVADVVSLDKNNRILVQQGLQRIRAGKCCSGIRALLSIANRSIEKAVAADLGFAVGPRLNAAGRLEDMSLGINCLLADDLIEAQQFAMHLDKLNNERRAIEKNMRKEALEILDKYDFAGDNSLPSGVCLFNEGWHQGVVGVLASRIKERIYRPVIAFALDGNDELKGSARSIPGLHVRDLLEIIASSHSGLITKFGGHAMAAGLSVPRKAYAEFSRVFNDVVKKHLNESNSQNHLMTDGELESSYLSLKLAELLRYASPWGQDFTFPLFDGKFRVLQQKILADYHLKLTLEHGSESLDAIMFNVDLQKWPNNNCQHAHLAYRLDVNEFRGRKQLQLLVEHIEPVYDVV